jgi:hypothetical protein
MLHFRLILDECRDAQFRREQHLTPLDFDKQGMRQENLANGLTMYVNRNG